MPEKFSFDDLKGNLCRVSINKSPTGDVPRIHQQAIDANSTVENCQCFESLPELVLAVLHESVKSEKGLIRSWTISGEENMTGRFADRQGIGITGLNYQSASSILLNCFMFNLLTQAGESLSFHF